MSGGSTRKPHREVIEGIDYSEAIKALRIEYRRLDEALEAAIPILTTRPQLFPAPTCIGSPWSGSKESLR